MCKESPFNQKWPRPWNPRKPEVCCLPSEQRLERSKHSPHLGSSKAPQAAKPRWPRKTECKSATNTSYFCVICYWASDYDVASECHNSKGCSWAHINPFIKHALRGLPGPGHRTKAWSTVGQAPAAIPTTNKWLSRKSHLNLGSKALNCSPQKLSN